MNLKNINVKFIGLIISFSLIIPPNYGLDFLGINFEDIPVIFLFVVLFYRKLTNLTITRFDKTFISFWILFIFYSNIFTQNFQIFNQTNIRFYFYFLLAYLCVDVIKKSKSSMIEFFEPLSIVVVANFIVVIFQIQLPEIIDGWILNNSGSTNFLTSGRLGGVQGGGPNVIGLICSIYALVCIFKVLESKNILINLKDDKLNAIFLIISIFNLYITFSRGSYIAFFIGLLVILF